MSGDGFRGQIAGIAQQQWKLMVLLNGAIPRPVLRRQAMTRFENIITFTSTLGFALMAALPVVIGVVSRL